jgi:hypothetical protein
VKTKRQAPEFSFSAHQDGIHIYYCTKTEKEGREIFKQIKKSHKDVPFFEKFHDKMEKWNYDKQCHEIYCFCSIHFSCHYLGQMVNFLKS